MIYQVKGISGYVWGVCVGGCGCAWVCACVCAVMHGCAWVSASVHGCARVFAGVDGYSRVYAGVCGCAQVCAGVCVDMHVCGMNFQNFFWRIESLHQRTLIRILYEFFSNNSYLLVPLY